MISNSIKQQIDIEIQSSHAQIVRKNLQQNSQQALSTHEALAINKNGFTNRPTIHQILPVIYKVFISVEIALILQKIQHKRLAIALSVTQVILFLIVIVFWVITTKIDPTDHTQILHRQAIKNKANFNVENFKYFCHICQTCVSKNSFHCKKCNRCVDVFDHHCKWLNNCIGAKNYLQFFGLILSVQILVIFHLVVNCLAVYQQSQNSNLTWIFYLAVVFVISDAALIIANSILLFLHIYILVSKKTTLQLILERRKVNKIHPSLQYSKQQYKQKNTQNTSNVQSTSGLKRLSRNSKVVNRRVNIKKNEQKQKQIEVQSEKGKQNIKSHLRKLLSLKNRSKTNQLAKDKS